MNYPNLTFEKPNLETFTNLQLAYDAMAKGGNAPCVLNAANEVTVDAFLNDRISFVDISSINDQVMNQFDFVKDPVIDELFETDKKARVLTKSLIK
jgi:1-deoxy-D-xylulose-5-phosphate reductoisomerase